jgi:hypothetical protein
VDGDVAHRGGGGGLRRAGAGVDGGAAGVGGGPPRPPGLLLRHLLHIGAAGRLLPVPGPRPRRRQQGVHRRSQMLPRYGNSIVIRSIVARRDDRHASLLLYRSSFFSGDPLLRPCRSQERDPVRVRSVRQPVGHARGLHHHRQQQHDVRTCSFG